MASLGKITSSILAAYNENTAALASVNFNFALLRVDAPASFRGLGLALSDARRKDAEEGPIHQTARKLGALFEQVVDLKRDLLNAYGTRVSDISAMEAINPKASSNYGLFQQHVGADGTAIWAAARSGSSAIAASMLACMLAVLFRPSEATSIWSELVAARKKEIQNLCDGSEASHLGLIEAAKQEISRSELADWDAKARAWLSRADEAMKRQQTQLQLILNNLDIPVDGSKDVYTSVIRAWNSAMQMMDNLIHGVPQRVSTGAVLLALSAWHLYPDLIYFGGPSVKKIEFKDELFKEGGQLTIGLDPSSEHGNGVYWSLSLGHLRYYGGEQVVSRSTNKDASRINFEELCQATLGSFLTGLPEDEATILQNCEIMVRIYEKSRTTGGIHRDRFSWLKILTDAARKLLMSSGADRQRAMILCRTGLRHGHTFLGHKPCIDPTFHLLKVANFLEALRDEDEVAFLRLLVMRSGLDASRLLIRKGAHTSYARRSSCALSPPAFASVALSQISDNLGAPKASYVSWMTKDGAQEDQGEGNIQRCRCGMSFYRGPKKGAAQGYPGTCQCFKCSNPQDHLQKYRLDDIREEGDLLFWHNPPALVLHLGGLQPHAIHDVEESTVAESRHPKHVDASSSTTLQSTSTNSDMDVEEIPDSFLDWEQQILAHDKFQDYRTAKFTCIAGNDRHCALFLRMEQDDDRMFVDDCKRAIADTVNDISFLQSNLAKFALRPGYLEATISNLDINTDGLTCLRSLSAAAQVYAHMPDATVSLQVMKQPLSNFQWASSQAFRNATLEERTTKNFLLPKPLTRQETFASIVGLAGGFHDISPRELEAVMAVSFENTIYAAATLMHDPYVTSPSFAIQRIIGNVGRAGIAFLVPPQQPRMREAGLNNWHLIQHKDFEWDDQDNFGGTSIHLWFTGFNEPIPGSNTRGVMDVETFFLETVVSVHDRGKWVADLDVLKAIENQDLLHRAESCEERWCLHNNNMKRKRPHHLVTVDVWDELLDPSKNSMVVRCHNNWLSRLAAAVVSVQKNLETWVLPERRCWPGVIEEAFSRSSNSKKTFIG